jgi:hypothetical protein
MNPETVEAGGLQIRRCRRFAVANYGFTSGAFLSRRCLAGGSEALRLLQYQGYYRYIKKMMACWMTTLIIIVG